MASHPLSSQLLTREEIKRFVKEELQLHRCEIDIELQEKETEIETLKSSLNFAYQEIDSLKEDLSDQKSKTAALSL